MWNSNNIKKISIAIIIDIVYNLVHIPTSIKYLLGYNFTLILKLSREEPAISGCNLNNKYQLNL